MKDKPPTQEEWDALGVIVDNLSLIIEDAPGFVAGGEPRGLFDYRSDALPTTSTPVSRLGAFIEIRNEWAVAEDEAPSTRPLWMQGAGAAIGKVLPEAKSIGTTPEERTKRLKVLLPRLRAYSWMNRNGDLAAAVSTLETVSRVGQIATTEDFELALLRLIRRPIQTYVFWDAFKDKVSFPSNADIDSAIRAAGDLKGFFDRNSGALLEMDGNLLMLTETLERTVEHLAQIKKRQDRQPQTLDGLRRHLVKVLCIGLMKAFGVRSPTVVLHLLAIVEYSPDDRHLRRQVRDVLEEAGFA
jgi:hypothetical protein